MALTPESLTEQHMQPLARSSHSVAEFEPSLTVRDFLLSSGMLDVLPNSTMDVSKASEMRGLGLILETWYRVSYR